MTLLLNGTNGVSDVDGSASTPAVRGTDTNTGIFFPAADTIAFAEGGAEVARFDSSGNLKLITSTSTNLFFGTSASSYQTIKYNDSDGSLTVGSVTGSAYPVIVQTGGSERMRIDSSGNLCVGKTSTTFSTVGSYIANNGEAGITRDGGESLNLNRLSSDGQTVRFFRQTSLVGNISVTTSATAYNTSSDYRLKDNVAPMTGALAVVGQLKPCTYTWKIDGSSGQGFIAHELAEVVPDCVTGEKDAVNEDGSIKPQGIDTSFLVATLTCAIQELKAELDTVKTELATLKGQA